MNFHHSRASPRRPASGWCLAASLGVHGVVLALGAWLGLLSGARDPRPLVRAEVKFEAPAADTDWFGEFVPEPDYELETGDVCADEPELIGEDGEFVVARNEPRFESLLPAEFPTFAWRWRESSCSDTNDAAEEPERRHAAAAGELPRTPQTPQVVEASPLACPPPEYPRSSLRRREEGTVLVVLEIGADGRVLAARLEESSGFPRLDEAALRGLRAWRFRPATKGGVAVACSHLQRVTFCLARRPNAP